MFANTPDRPFYSYVITQSALVLIVLTASYLLTFLAFEHFGLHIDRILMSFGLILMTQLPVAAMYARTEEQEVDGNRGWLLAFVFVSVTFMGEAALQLASGHLLETWEKFNGLAAAARFDTLVTAVCGVLAAVLLCVTFSKIVFRLAVTCHLRQFAKDSDLSAEPDELASETGEPHGVSRNLHRPKVSQDFSEFFRRELVGANIGIFGLALVMFGPDFMTILKISIPASLVFSVICVANRLARSETRTSISARSLHISLQMLPLTVTCLILLALGELYSAYTATLAAEVSPLEFASVAASGLARNTDVLWGVSVDLGMIFALSLAANTLMLVLFTRLIRPLVRGAVPAAITPRVEAPRTSPESRLLQIPVAPDTIGFTKGRDVAATLKYRETATERPKLMLQMNRVSAA
ncbi:hypothetical protein [Neptunicoccus cionae]|uniref:Uncharacterized protein n=1 Tax=Neptunicoccus cionae TaxID=2035344 RepID=A0A916QUG1_9RHOB|nr:hypothetical protein [Amylibacter cionae]GGA10735.1 hypothetical protein GCM10011498_08590 [Amylibacter cionae]